MTWCTPRWRTESLMLSAEVVTHLLDGGQEVCSTEVIGSAEAQRFVVPPLLCAVKEWCSDVSSTCVHVSEERAEMFWDHHRL